jgi:hypothetical protein
MKNLSRIINSVLREEDERRSSRYMFFSNLEQMRRQCDLLLDMDHDMIEEILENGHDWAQDHISEAKNNMDQVFDFLMNESKEEGTYMSNVDNKDMMMAEGRKKQEQNYALVVRHPLKLNMTYTQVHIVTVTPSKYVKGK